MGCSMSLVLADIVLKTLEEETINKLIFKIPLFSRFVDDCVAWPKDKTDELKDTLNNYNIKMNTFVDVDLCRK